MTPARRAAETANKRAERQRRKEAGEVRVEVWLSPANAAWVRRHVDGGTPASDVIQDAIYFVRGSE